MTPRASFGARSLVLRTVRCVTRHHRPRKGSTRKKPDSDKREPCTAKLALLVLIEVIRCLGGPWMT